jgi:hypothetical protein
MAAPPRREGVTAGTGRSFSVRIAGRALRVTGDAGVDAIRPAFAGVIEPVGLEEAALPTLRVSVHPDPASKPGWAALDIGSHRAPDGCLAILRRGPSSVEQFIPGVDPALLLEASPAALASGDLRSQPAHHALAAWLSGPRMQMVHAGAVSLDGRAALFIGVGGRGKTTTALVCARAGFGFLGDDLCVVEAGDPSRGTPATVHGVYATSKLNADSRQRLQAGDWPVLGITPSGKSAVALPPQITFQRSARLVAIVAVRAGDASVPQPRRLPPRQAIQMLGSTALPIASGSGTPGHWLSTAAALVREVPAFELGLGWDLDRVLSAVAGLLKPGGNQA